MSVELSCVAPGFTTVISKTATTVTLAINSNVTNKYQMLYFFLGEEEMAALRLIYQTLEVLLLL